MPLIEIKMENPQNPQLFSCAGEEKLSPVHFRTCLHYKDYACHYSMGDNCNGNIFKLYDTNALEEFIGDLKSCISPKETITYQDLTQLKQYINSFQLTLYPPKQKEDEFAPEYVKPLDRNDLLCNNKQKMIDLYQVINMIKKIMDKDTKTDNTDIKKLKELIKTKLSWIPKRITNLCNGTHTDKDMALEGKMPLKGNMPLMGNMPPPPRLFKTPQGGRRHTKKRNRKQKKTRSSLRSRRY